MLSSWITDTANVAGILAVLTLFAGFLGVVRAWLTFKSSVPRTFAFHGRLDPHLRARIQHLTPEQFLTLQHLEHSGQEASIAELTTEVRISPTRARSILLELCRRGIVANPEADVFTVTDIGRAALRQWSLAAEAGVPVEVTAIGQEKSSRPSAAGLSDDELDDAIDRALTRAAGPA